MAEWMGSPEMAVNVTVNWALNAPIFITNAHFQNKGQVLQYDEELKLSYSHLSDISHLPDIPESYAVLEFVLTPVEAGTTLILNIKNFPTVAIRKHLEFYWRTTIVKIKKIVEDNS